MSEPTGTTMKEAALGYAVRGLPVLPLHTVLDGHCSCRNPNCSSVGKHPRNKNGLSEATTDPETIKRWWSQWPDSNIGAENGPRSGILTIDVDPRNGGSRSFDYLQEELGELPDEAPLVQTPGGGTHILLAYPKDCEVATIHGMLPGIDIQGRSSYIAVAPSIGANGTRYEWLVPLNGSVPPLPQPWLDRIKAGKKRQHTSEPRAQEITEGNRNAHLASLGGSMRRRGMTEEAILAALSVENRTQCKPPLDEREVETIAHSVARYLPQSAVTAAAPSAGKITKPTDDELRDRWLARYPNTLHARDDFLRYHNGLWSIIPGTIIRQEIEAVLVEAKQEKIRPTKSLLASVVDLAKAKTAARDEIFDAQTDYLVCKNGTLYLPTRTLGEWKPEHYLTRGADYSYQLNAPRRGWDRFIAWLTDTQGNEVVELLQEFGGLSITHNMQFDVAIWLVGQPGGGKSTFIEGVRAALSDRVTTLGLRAIERSQFALSNLPGRTLATCGEQPADFIAATDVLNAIISGETVTVERKYHHPYDINPTVKLLWAMNDKPRISDPNNGIFRRVKIVEFPPIDPANIDTNLKAQIRTEGAGILNWLLDGLERLLARGFFCIPLSVCEATKEYQEHADVPGAFLDECAERNPQPLNEIVEYREKSGDIYGSYRQWAINGGHKPVSITRIRDDWKRLGLTRKRIDGQSYWYGVRLRSNAPRGAV